MQDEITAEATTETAEDANKATIEQEVKKKSGIAEDANKAAITENNYMKAAEKNAEPITMKQQQATERIIYYNANN
jgi:hypothetical protein